MLNVHFRKTGTLLIFSLFLLSQNIFSQQLDESFLASLPKELQEGMNQKNEDDERLEDLFKAETSIESNARLLKRLMSEIEALDRKIRSQEPSLQGDKKLQRFGASFFDTFQSSFMPINLPNMDGNYIIDVGDKISILLTGSKNSNDEYIVERDGSILVDQVSKINVAGRSLADVSKIIAATIQESFPGAKTNVSLTSLRDIRVIVVGLINFPGIYTLSGGSNILSAINAAGGISENGSFRTVSLIRENKTIQDFDLYELFAFGEFDLLSSSLRSGDIIRINPSGINIPISGGILNDAVYELLPNETVSDLLKYAGGTSSSYVGFDNLIIKRFIDGKYKDIELNINEAYSFILKPRDSVYLPVFQNKIEAAKTVEVSGSVNVPGIFSINEFESLSDVIKKAGGYTDDAYPFGGVLIRKNTLDLEKEYSNDEYVLIVKNLLRAKTAKNAQGGLLQSSSGDEVFDLIDLLKSFNKFSGRVQANFNLYDLEANPGLDITIESGDKIYIPKFRPEVYMLGAFQNPSTLIYHPDLAARDYVNAVGGFSSNSKKIALLISPDGKTSIYNHSELRNLFSNENPLYPGSIIYASPDFGNDLSNIEFLSAVAPVISSLTLSLASLNVLTN